MDLEVLNNEFLKLTTRLKELNTQLTNTSSEIQDLKGDLRIIEGKIEEAKRANNQTDIDKYNKEKENKENELKNVESNLQKVQSAIDNVSKQIDIRVQKVIENNPEVQAEFDKLLKIHQRNHETQVIADLNSDYRKFEAEKHEKEKEKDSLEQKKDRFNTLSNKLKKQPSLVKLFEQLLKDVEELKNLEKQLMSLEKDANGKYKDPAAAKKLQKQINAKNKSINKKKETLKGFDIHESDIDDISNNIQPDSKDSSSLDNTIEFIANNTKDSIDSLENNIKNLDTKLDDIMVAIELAKKDFNINIPEKEEVAKNETVSKDNPTPINTTEFKNTEPLFSNNSTFTPQQSEALKNVTNTKFNEPEKWYKKVAKKLKEWKDKFSTKLLAEPTNSYDPFQTTSAPAPAIETVPVAEPTPAANPTPVVEVTPEPAKVAEPKQERPHTSKEFISQFKNNEVVRAALKSQKKDLAPSKTSKDYLKEAKALRKKSKDDKDSR